jgi:glycosyltransferase involved in cell wall biosynthesis
MNSLLVILAEPISGWVEKGEIIDRYFNPSSTFDHVNIFLLNDDTPDETAVKRLVGDAEFRIYNFPAGPKLFLSTLGWRPSLMGVWTRRMVTKAKELNPQIVRCYSAHLNIEVARRIKKNFGIPYFVSLHINPDADLNTKGNVKQRIARKAIRRIELMGLQNADLVLPVYSTIIPFLESKRVFNFDVSYNMTNEESLKRKTNYSLRSPAEILSVGRQFTDKDPSNIIRAIALIPNTHLTLIGDGPLHESLHSQVVQLNIEDRVTMIKATSNDDICQKLASTDIFVIQSKFREIPKTVLEALLTGTPTIINSDLGDNVMEFSREIVQYSPNSIEGYRQTIQDLLQDDSRREQIGRAGFGFASKTFASKDTESKFARLYSRYVTE